MIETKEEVIEWKAKREAGELNARADRAEMYAVAAINYAGAIIDEVEEPILDAVVAQLDVDACSRQLHLRNESSAQIWRYYNRHRDWPGGITSLILVYPVHNVYHVLLQESQTRLK